MVVKKLGKMLLDGVEPILGINLGSCCGGLGPRRGERTMAAVARCCFDWGEEEENLATRKCSMLVLGAHLQANLRMKE
jgi:hypothetical protein